MTMKQPKRKIAPGHKRAKVRYGVEVECECGWRSSVWYGKGASRNAHGEYHQHLDEHEIRTIRASLNGAPETDYEVRGNIYGVNRRVDIREIDGINWRSVKLDRYEIDGISKLSY